MDYNIQFEVAEVISGYDNTYKYIASGSEATTDKLFTIQVQTVNRFTKKTEIYTCRPANINFKQIPLIGEHVLIFRAYNQETTLENTSLDWYYLNTYPIQSSINANLLPGISYRKNISEDDIKKIKFGNVFKPKNISPLQPHEGDMLIEGRWGNTIRIGSTVQSQPGIVDTLWKGDTVGDPIITIVNGQQNKENKQFVTENLKQDPASLYLTSTQTFPSFYLGTETNKRQLKKFTAESQFNGSQLIGVADRIIISSKKDISVIDSNKAIVLNAPKVFIGKDKDVTPIPDGNVLYEIINHLLSAISAGTTGTAGVVSSFIDQASISAARKKLNKLKSKNYFIGK